jgi:hypothetical protein
MPDIDLVIEAPNIFPPGTVVSAYRTSATPRAGEPAGNVADAQMVDPAGSARFWLSPQTSYVLAARGPLGTWRYLPVETGPAPPVPAVDPPAAPPAIPAVDPPPASPTSGGGAYVHQQTNPSDRWQILHSLGREPAAVRITDNVGEQVLTEVVTTDASLVVVAFTEPMSGRAFLL